MVIHVHAHLSSLPILTPIATDHQRPNVTATRLIIRYQVVYWEKLDSSCGSI